MRTVSVNASDNVGVVRVVFTISNAPGCTVTAPPYSCQLNFTGGSLFTLSARAFDAAGNSAYAENNGFIDAGPTPTNTPVGAPTPTPTRTPTPTPTRTPTNTPVGSSDTTPPVLSNLQPPSGGHVTAGARTVSVNASDNVGVVRVVFTLNSAPDCVVTAPPYSCSMAFAGSLYTLGARAFDAAGNSTYAENNGFVN
jgi:xanthine/uracil permease